MLVPKTAERVKITNSSDTDYYKIHSSLSSIACSMKDWFKITKNLVENRKLRENSESCKSSTCSLLGAQHYSSNQFVNQCRISKIVGEVPGTPIQVGCPRQKIGAPENIGAPPLAKSWQRT